MWRKRILRTLSSKPKFGGFSLFADNVGKIVTPRHNTGLANQNHYLQMTITLATENRISSSHLSDAPLLHPSEVHYFPTPVDIQRMSMWLRYWMEKEIVKYHSAFKSCAKFISPPDVKYKQKLSQKSNMMVLALDLEDPSSSEGMINVSRRLVPYLPSLPNSEKQKTCVHGDQGFFEKGHHATWSLCNEKSDEQKLAGLCFLPQEWHKKREDLFIYNEKFNISNQITQAGTLQNVKSSFNHNKASKDVSHFYASWDLMQATTLINLVRLVEIMSGKEMGSEALSLSSEDFHNLVDRVYKFVDPFSNWAPAVDKETAKNLFNVDESESDEVLLFHKDLLFRGLVQCAQKCATQFGDCLALTSFWKNSMGDYHLAKKWKYRIAAFTKIAASEGVYGEKIQTDSVYNCLINDQGLKDSNVYGDLKVEHINKMFKAGLLDLAGNYSEENLRRVALSMDLGKKLEDKLYPGYVESEESAFKIHLGHRNVDWSDQVVKGVSDMKDQKIFTACPGRKVEGYRKKSEVDLKALKKFVKKQSRELGLYIQDTFKSF